MSLVEIENLSKSFGGFQAVDNISFAVRRGDVLGFLGPNGAGKSTTMRMAAGFTSPSAGDVRLKGHSILTEPVKAKTALGYLPEGAPAYGDMTGRAFLKFMAEVRGYRGAEINHHVDLAAERAVLTEMLDQPIETLSKGYKRRVGLAQAVLHDPDILILDEPTDGLDPNQKHEVRRLIKDLAADKAIIISTHILEEVEPLCNRVVLINKGRLVMDGTPEDLLAHSPSHQAVMVTIHDLHGAVEALKNLNEVKKVAVLDHQTLCVYPAGKAPIMTTVAKALHQGDFKVEAMHQAPGRMDEAFRALTTDQDGGDQA